MKKRTRRLNGLKNAGMRNEKMENEKSAVQKLRESFMEKGVDVSNLSDDALVKMVVVLPAAKREAGIKIVSQTRDLEKDKAEADACDNYLSVVIASAKVEFASSGYNLPEGAEFDIRMMIVNRKMMITGHRHRRGSQKPQFWGTDGTNWTSDNLPTDRVLDQNGNERLGRSHKAQKEKEKNLKK